MKNLNASMDMKVLKKMLKRIPKSLIKSVHVITKLKKSQNYEEYSNSSHPKGAKCSAVFVGSKANV
jgi:hypothetical protein